MKILISINAYKMGGGQIFAIRLANYLSKEHDVTIFDHEPYRRDPGVIDLVDQRVKKKSFFEHRAASFIFHKIIKKLFNSREIINYLHVIRFKRVLKSVSPDVINSHIIGSDELVAKAKTGIPVVISTHGCYEDYRNKYPDWERMFNIILKNSDGIICAADKNMEAFREFPEIIKNKIQKIYYGFSAPDVKKDSGVDFDLPAEALTFGMVARSIPSKGWEEVIQAFLSLRENYKMRDLRLLIICDETEYYYSLKEKYSGVSSIHFIGFAQEPVKWIRKLDVALLPTYFPGESLPNSIIEYLSCGKPVIASDIGEIREMIKGADGEMAGIIIPLNEERKTDVSLVSQAMETLLTNEDLRMSMGKAAAKAFEKFDMKTCADEYVNYFFKVVNSAK